jgi:hypothetical protein
MGRKDRGTIRARGSRRFGWRSAPAALVLVVAVVGLTSVLLLISAAGAAIPSNYFVVIDQNGPNDVPAQVDLTQFGRDDSDPSVFKLFWS